MQLDRTGQANVPGGRGTGMPKPEIRTLLDLPAVAGREATFGRAPHSAQRIAEIVAGLRALPAATVEKHPVSEVRDFNVGERPTPVRLYRPAVDGPLPVCVYFHGGGWVFGGLGTHDALCRTLANAGACLVVSVDYSLAPEHPFPGPVHECLAVTRELADQAASYGGDPGRVAVAGASSGGNLAAAVALLLVAQAGPALVGQVLLYPALDATTSLPSFEENASGYNLSATEMRFYWTSYHQGRTAPTDPLLSPVHAPDLTGLPPTLIHTAELDVLRDEGELYAERLAAAGVPTVLARYDGQIHGFHGLSHLTADAGHSLAEVGGWLRDIFAR